MQIIMMFVHELFFIFKVFRQSAEKMPSVQSFVATSSFPNICAAVIALGFIRISLKIISSIYHVSTNIFAIQKNGIPMIVAHLRK